MAFVSTCVRGGVVEGVLEKPVTADPVDRDDQSALTLRLVRNLEVDQCAGRWVSGKVF